MNWGNIIGAAGSLLGNKEEEKEPEVKVAPKTKLSRLNGVISDLTNVYKNDTTGSQEAAQAGEAIGDAFESFGKLSEAIKERHAAKTK